MSRVLIVDDEDTFRIPLARRLRLRGIDTVDLNNSQDAVKVIRNDSEIDVRPVTNVATL